jgi:hypothetical protein
MARAIPALRTLCCEASARGVEADPTIKAGLGSYSQPPRWFKRFSGSSVSCPSATTQSAVAVTAWQTAQPARRPRSRMERHSGLPPVAGSSLTRAGLQRWRSGGSSSGIRNRRVKNIPSFLMTCYRLPNLATQFASSCPGSTTLVTFDNVERRPKSRCMVGPNR